MSDRLFSHTKLVNTYFDSTLINNNRRAVVWVPDEDIELQAKTLTESDISFLLARDNLFAWKFDADVDAEIFDVLDWIINADR